MEAREKAREKARDEARDEARVTVILPPRKGSCRVCGAFHPQELPHNRESAYYQMRFRQRHGRFPSWEDAWAHCSEAVKAEWRALFEANDIETERANG